MLPQTGRWQVQSWRNADRPATRDARSWPAGRDAARRAGPGRAQHDQEQGN